MNDLKERLRDVADAGFLGPSAIDAYAALLTEAAEALDERDRRIGELEAGIGHIARMHVFPDNAINISTLAAATQVARALLPPGPEQ